MHTLLTNQEYYQELLRKILKSKHRVVITAMTTDFDESTAPIFELLSRACERGVAVSLVFDSFTKLPFSQGVGEYFQHGRQRLQKLEQTCDQLRAKGADVTFVKSIGFNPFKGRYHCKATVIDDTVYSYGGVNFTHGSFHTTDYMLKHISSAEADIITSIIQDFQTNTAIRDGKIELDSKTSALLDAGRQKESIIYQTACDLATQSKRAIFVSQMQPTGRLADELQNIDTTYHFNHPQQFFFPANLGAIIDQYRHPVKNSYRRSAFIHAKYILYELNDGGYAVISGSNNFNWRGVKYGTAEIALVSYNKKLYAQLLGFTQAKVAKRRDRLY